MGCCSSRPYETVFGARSARRDLARYRKKGLKKDARQVVAFLRERGIEGATVLEVGGGIGAVQRELLEAGAAGTVNVELSHGYETAAAEVAAGFDDRVERRFGDFAEQPVDPADAVVLVRVVCCYPDAERLVGAAARSARRLLVLTFPVENRLVRLGLPVVNAVMRRLTGGFEAYAHPHRLLHEIAERHGLRLVHEGGGRIWRVAGFERV